jgi:hypothetical protein
MLLILKISYKRMLLGTSNRLQQHPIMRPIAVPSDHRTFFKEERFDWTILFVPSLIVPLNVDIIVTK